MLFRSKNKAEPEETTLLSSTGVDGKAEQLSAAPKEAAPGRPGPEIRKPSTADGSASNSASTDGSQRRALSSIRQSVAFAQIASLLMRSPHYRHYTLGDLEWLVIPPLVTGQYIVANTRLQQNGATVPIAMALWASVSAEVDKKLAENLHLPVRLRPDEWRSGDVLWLIDAVGDPRAVPQLLKQLVETRFKGREVKIRVPGENGKVTVQRIGEMGFAGGVTPKH
jgi:hemolysin-activating ACP:hemolysin acyltransferase